MTNHTWPYRRTHIAKAAKHGSENVTISAMTVYVARRWLLAVYSLGVFVYYTLDTGAQVACLDLWMYMIRNWEMQYFQFDNRRICCTETGLVLVGDNKEGTGVWELDVERNTVTKSSRYVVNNFERAVILDCCQESGAVALNVTNPVFILSGTWNIRVFSADLASPLVLHRPSATSHARFAQHGTQLVVAYSGPRIFRRAAVLTTQWRTPRFLSPVRHIRRVFRRTLEHHFRRVAVYAF